MERNGETWYYIYDGHGSVRHLADSNGNLTDHYSYDAFGNLLEKEGTTQNDFLYAGEQYNAGTGLYYLRARYMDPSTGTFISMDSYPGSIYDPVSLHKYLYANANPVMYTDPSGYFSLGELVGCTSISEILSTSANYLALNALRGMISGGIIGAVDSWLGGDDILQIMENFCKGAAIGGGIGLLLSALTCLAVVYPLAITTLSVFRGIFLVTGTVSTYISCKEENILQGILRGTLTLFSFKSMGKTIENVKLFNKYSKSIIFETDCGNGISRTSHRRTANKSFINEVQQNTEFKTQMDEIFGYDVEKYMLSGKNGVKDPLNPSKNYVWHHSAYVKGKMQLIPKIIHQASEMAPILHPNGDGGYALFYGKGKKVYEKYR